MKGKERGEAEGGGVGGEERMGERKKAGKVRRSRTLRHKIYQSTGCRWGGGSERIISAKLRTQNRGELNLGAAVCERDSYRQKRRRGRRKGGGR